MLTLELPDGSKREVPAGTPAVEVVRSIGERLARDAVAVQVAGEVQDLATPLRKSGKFRVLTDKDPEALAVLRHSAAHILATAVRRLRPDAKIGFGPAIEDGFYYDFEVREPFTPQDLEAFEAEMRRVAQEKLPFVREEVSADDARTTRSSWSASPTSVATRSSPPTPTGRSSTSVAGRTCRIRRG